TVTVAEQNCALSKAKNIQRRTTCGAPSTKRLHWKWTCEQSRSKGRAARKVDPRQLPNPVPSDSEVLIEVAAAGVNHPTSFSARLVTHRQGESRRLIAAGFVLDRMRFNQVSKQ